MAINPLGTPIALQIRPLDLLRAEQTKGARIENEAFAQKTGRENALRSFFEQSGPDVLKGDPNAVNEYARIAGPQAALELQGQSAENKKREMDANLTRLRAVSNGLDSILNVPEGPGKLATQTLLFEQQKKYLQGLGIPMDDVPDLWDEEWARTARATAETSEERLKRMTSDPNYLARVARDEARAKAEAARMYPQSQPAPSGYQWNQNGTQSFVPGGPADPKQVGQLAETRREVIINNPTPSQQQQSGGRTITERMQSVVLNGDPTSPEYAAAYAYLAKPRVLFDPNTGETIQVAPDMSWARRPGAKGGAQPQGAQPIPGAGAGEGRPEVTRGPGRSASPTQATFQANIQQAQSDIGKAEAMLFPGAKYENGSLVGGQFARGTATTGAVSIPFAGQGLPFSEGREARQAVRRAVEIILRLRTGAAAPDQEVDNYVNLYAPSPADSEAAARTKMERLRQFFETEKSAASSKLPQTGSAPSSGFTVTPSPNNGWSVQRVP
jgi:hypothetical protein